MGNLAILVLNIIAENNKIYGYSVGKRLKEVGVFISHQVIYRATSLLLKEALVSIEIIPNEGKPDRHLYSITAKGRRELTVAIPTSRGKDITPYLLAMLYPENLIYVTWAMAHEQNVANKLKKVLETSTYHSYIESLLFENTHRLENIKHLAKAHEKK